MAQSHEDLIKKLKAQKIRSTDEETVLTAVVSLEDADVSKDKVAIQNAHNVLDAAVKALPKEVVKKPVPQEVKTVKTVETVK